MHEYSSFEFFLSVQISCWLHLIYKYVYKTFGPSLCKHTYTCTLVVPPPLHPSLLLQVAQWQPFMSTTQLGITQCWRSYAADCGHFLELPPVSNLYKPILSTSFIHVVSHTKVSVKRSWVHTHWKLCYSIWSIVLSYKYTCTITVLAVTFLTVVHQLSYLWWILMGERVTRLRCTFTESFTTTQKYFWYSHFSHLTVSNHPTLFPLPHPFPKTHTLRLTCCRLQPTPHTGKRSQPLWLLPSEHLIILLEPDEESQMMARLWWVLNT